MSGRAAGAGRRRASGRGLVGLLAAALLLGGCAPGQPGATAVAVLVEPTATQTAGASPNVATTPTAVPTETPSPPTQTPRPPTADFSAWQAAESDLPGRYRRSYDAATGEYSVEILEAEQEWSFYSPYPTQHQDVRIEVEARRASGEDGTGYGLVFRRQVPQAGQVTSERYIFFVTDQGLYGLSYVDGDNRSTRIKDPTPAPEIIRPGDEPNKLAVICTGSAVRLLINDQEVYQTGDLTLVKPGDVGIFAGSGPTAGRGTRIVFRDFRLVTEP